ncbi:MAG: DUF3488 and transglutaminase-like domain-containing protein [Pseudomonadota bacterium]
MIQAGQRTALVALLGLASLLHMLHLPRGLSAVLLVCAILPMVIGRLPKGLPRRLAPVVIGSVAAVAVLAQVAWSSGHAIVTLLACAGWLKMAEIHGGRDQLLIWVIGFWLLGMSALWLPQGPALLLIALGLTVAFWALAILTSERTGARRILQTFGLALPLATLLFTFTPRITGDLGALSFALGIPLIIETEAEKKRDPMQDSLTMGQVAERASNQDLRVLTATFFGGSGKFFNGVPPLGDLYWRGPVLWSFADGKWAGRPGWANRTSRMRGKITHKTLDRELRETGLISVYDVTLFPHRGHWLYSLDFPAAVPPSSFITRDYQLQNLNPVRELLSYPMMSYLDYRAGPELDPETRAAALQLAEGQNPLTLLLGKELRQEHEDPVGIAKAGLEVFDRDYRYDRRFGGVDGPDHVDRFLFEQRAGYAGHFATAYALIMRAADIPSRLVVGYRGGIHLGLTNRVFVTEEHAHAWAEIWLDDFGWVRMDPSTRFTQKAGQAEAEGWGLGAEMGAPAPEPAEESPETIETGDVETMRASAPTDTNTLSDTRSWWQKWIVEFDADRQIGILDVVSLSGNWKNLLFLGGAGGVVMLLALLIARRIIRLLEDAKRPFAERCERTLIRYLGRAGRRRRFNEGLHSYFLSLDQKVTDGVRLEGLVSELRGALYADRDLASDWAERFEKLTRMTPRKKS